MIQRILLTGENIGRSEKTFHRIPPGNIKVEIASSLNNGDWVLIVPPPIERKKSKIHLHSPTARGKFEKPQSCFGSGLKCLCKSYHYMTTNTFLGSHTLRVTSGRGLLDNKIHLRVLKVWAKECSEQTLDLPRVEKSQITSKGSIYPNSEVVVEWMHVSWPAL